MFDLCIGSRTLRNAVMRFRFDFLPVASNGNIFTLYKLFHGWWSECAHANHLTARNCWPDLHCAFTTDYACNMQRYSSFVKISLQLFSCCFSINFMHKVSRQIEWKSFVAVWIESFILLSFITLICGEIFTNRSGNQMTLTTVRSDLK